MEVIEDIRLRDLNNDLYSRYMRAVNVQIERVTPTALKISKCYTVFSGAREQLDDVYKTQKKNNLTEALRLKDKERDEYARCLLTHIEADLYSSDPAKRAGAQILQNKIDSYDPFSKLGRRAESEQMQDMGQAFCTSPWAEEIEKLGREEDRDAMIKANDEYMELDDQREQSQKMVVTNATIDARTALDKAYYDIVSAVNAQVMYKSLVDEDSGSSEPGLPEVQSEELDPLEDFVKSINRLIKSYKTTAEQSGSETKPEEGEGETPDTEEPDTETPGSETPEEPDDRPVVQ